MSKKALAIVAFFILMFSFQNCSQTMDPNSNSSEADVQKTDDEIPHVVLPVKSDSITVLNDPTKSNLEAFYLKISLQDGLVTRLDESLRPVIDKDPYCLSGNQMKELSGILAQSQVCYPPEKDLDGNNICALYYKYPYAILNGSYFEVKLGEATSSCDSPVDLCEEKPEMLKGFVSYLLKNIKKQVCHFQEL